MIVFLGLVVFAAFFAVLGHLALRAIRAMEGLWERGDVADALARELDSLRAQHRELHAELRAIRQAAGR
jgi:hypothetical protein